MTDRPWLIGNKHRVGKKMPESAKQAIAASLIGNSRRKGIPHSPEIKEQIATSMRRAHGEGRHASPFEEVRQRVAKGEIASPWVKWERNDEMVRLYLSGRPLRAIAYRYGLDRSGCRKTILAHIARQRSGQ